MNSLAMSMAQQELNDPNSQYYLGQPSILEQINNYMNGVNPSYGARGLTKRNMYIGQPVQDKFESAANIARGRKQEDIFSYIVTGTATVLGLLVLRKVPLVNKIPKLLGSVLKFTGNILAAAGKFLFKALK